MYVVNSIVAEGTRNGDGDIIQEKGERKTEQGVYCLQNEGKNVAFGLARGLLS